MDKDSKGQRKLEDSGGWLFPAVEGHSLEENRIVQVFKSFSYCCCCLLVSEHPSNMLVYLRDGPAETVGRAATLR